MTEKSIQDLVIEDMEDRKKLGIEKYGKLLYKDTAGRNHLQDLYEELLDACCYIRARIAEEADSTQA